jgi:hypothetical protein
VSGRADDRSAGRQVVVVMAGVWLTVVGIVVSLAVVFRLVIACEREEYERRTHQNDHR